MARTLVVALVVTLGIGLGAGALPGHPYPTVYGTVLDVTDGSHITIQIAGSTGGDWIPGSTETVHYIGLSIPTLCEAVAAQVNYQMTFGRLVYLEFDELLRDSDGTLLAYVYLDGWGFSMVNAMLIALGVSGTSTGEPNTRYADFFTALASTATDFGVGCYSTP